MKIFAFLATKGGCGKTTLAVNVACALATPRRSVALVDADTQGSATAWDIDGTLPITIHHDPLDDDTPAAEWVQRLRTLDADIVIIDSPPHLGTSAGIIANVADLCVIPVRPSAMDLREVPTVLDLAARAKTKVLLVPSQVDKRTAPGRQIEDALRDFKAPAGPSIGFRTAFVDAFSDGKSVLDFAPKSTAADEIRALTRRIARG